MSINKKSHHDRIRVASVARASFLAASMLAGTASAAGITIDGVYNPVNDMYTNSTQMDFLNDHWTQFSPSGNSTTVRWKVENDDLFVFGQVPLALKNMIWGGGVSADELALYNQAYSTHHDDLKPGELDYSKATGSEKFYLAAGGYSVDKTVTQKDVNGDDKTWTKYSLDKDDAVIVDLADYADGAHTQTSVDWVVKNRASCTSGSGSSCDATDVPMSFESKFTGDDKTTILAWLADWTSFNSGLTSTRPIGLVAHLSPERGGELKIPPVPLPAAFWLFGTALIGFIGISRRTSLG